MTEHAFQTRAKGKLLITGEYAVLDGALALALPVRYGQTLRVEPADTAGVLHWEALNADGATWFSGEFGRPSFEIIRSNDSGTAERLRQILLVIRQLNPDFLAGEQAGLRIVTQIDFPRQWGLGTSSTLIAAIARWAGVDPYALLAATFGGSGYDLACAYAEAPVLFHLKNGRPVVAEAHFSPAFSAQLYFVFLGKKQDSREGIRRYREKKEDSTSLVAEVSALTLRALQAGSLAEFEQVLAAHEVLMQKILDLPRARELYFPDYWGEVKSLGAWGGDFVLVTSARSEAETRDFFNEKGFGVFMRWKDMIL